MKCFTITKNESGIKLEKYILLKIDANQSFLNIILRKNIVRVNGSHPSDLKVVLKEGDTIAFYLNDEYFKKKVFAPFDIIYEDSNILVIDKNDKMPVHGVNDSHNNLIDYASKYLKDKGEFIPSIISSRPSVCNRLDTNTKGLVIIAKNDNALTFINQLIEQRKIKKFYHVLVKGKFDKEKDTLTDYLIKDEQKSLVKVSKEEVPGSKKIITKYELIKYKNDLSYLEIELITGRTHQIRAHLSFYNHPVIGDMKYGDSNLNNKLNVNTQELICYRLEFPEIDDDNFIALSGKVFTSKKHFKLNA